MSDQSPNTHRAFWGLFTASDAELRHRAADLRSRGRAQYVWHYGVLAVALPIAGVAATFLTLMTSDQPPVIEDAMPRWLGWVVVLLPLGMAVGVSWGLLMWRLFVRDWFPLLDAEQRGVPPAT